MRRIIIAILVGVFGYAVFADARKLPSWTYKTLLESSDVVIIGRMTGDKIIDSRSPDFGKIDVICHITTFKLNSVLKGDVADSIDVKHYELNKKAFIVGAINGPSLASFGQSPIYLLYLKKDTDGNYCPTSGQYDSLLSVYDLHQQTIREADSNE